MYSINLEPEAQELEAKNLGGLIERWLADLGLRLPASTVEGYAVKMAYFSEWWQTGGAGCGWRLSRGTLAAFNRWLTDQAVTKRGEPLSFHTRNDVLRRLRQMFRWARQYGYVPADISGWVPAVEGSAPLRVAPDMEAVARLIAAGEASGPRDMAILAVFLGTGVRRAEASALDVTDVTLYADLSGTLCIRKAKKVRGRDVHARMVAFDATTGEYIRRWLDLILPAGPLFPSSHIDREGDRLTPMGIYKVVRRIVSDAGLEDVIQGPHDLRRLFATTFRRYRRGAGYDSLLSRQLGHSGLTMTEKYVLTGVEDIRENIVSPLALLNGRS